MRWRLGPTSAVRPRGPRRWSCFLRVSHPGWREHAPAGCPFVRRVTEGICVRMTPTGCPTQAKRPWGGGGGAGRAREGHDATGRPLGACLLSLGARGACAPPPQHLTCHGDNVLAAVDRGRAGAGGSTVIMGSATRLTGIHIAQCCFSSPVSPPSAKSPDTFAHDHHPGSMWLAREL